MSQYPESFDTFTTKVDNVDYVLAEHVNFLQDIVDALQATLGLDPHGTESDVGSRIGAVDQRVEDAEGALSTHKGTGDHDNRYGGTGWTTGQTLMGHIHEGVAGKPGKVDLASHVDGKLPKSGIQLAPHDAAGTLTGHDISMSPSTIASINSTITDINALLDNHSSRHEDGGADEINLDNLSGESNELSAHKDNHVDPHIYEDISNDPNWSGVKYKLVVEEGQAYMEVISS